MFTLLTLRTPKTTSRFQVDITGFSSMWFVSSKLKELEQKHHLFGCLGLWFPCYTHNQAGRIFLWCAKKVTYFGTHISLYKETGIAIKSCCKVYLYNYCMTFGYPVCMFTYLLRPRIHSMAFWLTEHTKTYPILLQNHEPSTTGFPQILYFDVYPEGFHSPKSCGPRHLTHNARNLKV